LVIEGKSNYWMSTFIVHWQVSKAKRSFFILINSLRQKTENKKKRNVREHLNS
jgi:hypothetical protein